MSADNASSVESGGFTALILRADPGVVGPLPLRYFMLPDESYVAAHSESTHSLTSCGPR